MTVAGPYLQEKQAILETQQKELTDRSGKLRYERMKTRRMSIKG